MDEPNIWKLSELAAAHKAVVSFGKRELKFSSEIAAVVFHLEPRTTCLFKNKVAKTSFLRCFNSLLLVEVSVNHL